MKRIKLNQLVLPGHNSIDENGSNTSFLLEIQPNHHIIVVAGTRVTDMSGEYQRVHVEELK